MPKFRVWGAIAGTKYLGDFEADSEEALRARLEAETPYDSPSLCHQCSSEVEDPEVERYEIEEIRDSE